MKRSLITLDVKEGGVEIDSINTANCLILLSRGDHEESPSSPERVFECKTCNRQFQSFQALGGHRASHKRARIFEDRHGRALHGCRSNLQKVHECSICGTEFSMGQALGGHMRRHRSELQGGFLSSAAIVKKPIGVQRLCLDLNLPPLDNDGDILGLGLVGKFPMVH